MKKSFLGEVIKEMPISVLYFILGSAIGYIVSKVLFVFNRNSLEYILSIWFKRITFGLSLVGNNYGEWFILNNLVALLAIIASLLLMMTLMFRKRKFFLSRRFQNFEKHHTKISLYSLYTIPVGALMINGLLLSLFLTFVLLNSGSRTFLLTLALIIPHGVTELTALIISASLVLTYLQFLRPYILQGKWEASKKLGKELLFSQTTLLVVVFMIILIVFSGFLEGSLLAFLQQFQW